MDSLAEAHGLKSVTNYKVTYMISVLDKLIKISIRNKVTTDM